MIVMFKNINSKLNHLNSIKLKYVVFHINFASLKAYIY